MISSLPREQGISHVRFGRRLIVFAAFFLLLYLATAAIILRFFLAEIIFLELPPDETRENHIFHVVEDGHEVVIRQYLSDAGARCAVFFPGRHGGIARYEKQLFDRILKQGITLYTLSYPGYEGAAGKATFANLRSTLAAAIRHIDRQTPCKISDAVFIGRSLGAYLAVEQTTSLQPRALLLDSVAPSLADVFNARANDSFYLWPLRLLPIRYLIEPDMSIAASLQSAPDIPVIIFQGSKDALGNPNDIQKLVARQAGVELIIVPEGTHSNTFVIAGEGYIEKLESLYR